MTENEVFALVQAFRAMLRDKYQWALANHRYNWLAKPNGGEQNWVIRLQVALGPVSGSGKRGRLETLEALSVLFGWHNGATTDSLWRAYEHLKKALGRGHADRAFDEIRHDARKAWGLGSTKDLYLVEISALVEWLEQHRGMVALEHIARAPKEWADKLARLTPVKRPDNYVPKSAVAARDLTPPPLLDEDDMPLVLAQEPMDEFYSSLGL